MAWPVLGHVPAMLEVSGLVLVMMGLIIAVTVSTASTVKSTTIGIDVKATNRV